MIPLKEHSILSGMLLFFLDIIDSLILIFSF